MPFPDKKNSAQLDAALSFLSTLGPDSLDSVRFEEACGVSMFSFVRCRFIHYCNICCYIDLKMYGHKHFLICY